MTVEGDLIWKLRNLSGCLDQASVEFCIVRAGNVILTALAIGRVTCRNAAKNLQFATARPRHFDTRLGE